MMYGRIEFHQNGVSAAAWLRKYMTCDETWNKKTGGLEHFLFSHIFGIIIPVDFHMFQRGLFNHQPDADLYFFPMLIQIYPDPEAKINRGSGFTTKLQAPLSNMFITDLSIKCYCTGQPSDFGTVPTSSSKVQIGWDISLQLQTASETVFGAGFWSHLESKHRWIKHICRTVSLCMEDILHHLIDRLSHDFPRVSIICGGAGFRNPPQKGPLRRSGASLLTPRLPWAEVRCVRCGAEMGVLQSGLWLVYNGTSYYNGR